MSSSSKLEENLVVVGRNYTDISPASSLLLLIIYSKRSVKQKPSKLEENSVVAGTFAHPSILILAIIFIQNVTVFGRNLCSCGDSQYLCMPFPPVLYLEPTVAVEALLLLLRPLLMLRMSS